MSGQFQRVDEQRVPHQYVSDSGTEYYIMMQPKYTQVSQLQLINGTPTVPLYPYNRRNLRHIYIHTVEDGPTAGRPHSRFVPCAAFTGQQAPGSADGIDGLNNWRHGKLIGEKRPV